MFNIKLHPSDNNLLIETPYSNLHVIAQYQDVYETLAYTDILVSDYSSMVFEALYLSKPVALFCPDYKSYQKKSREFYIDPCNALPVEIAYTQKELEEKLLLLTQHTPNTEKLENFSPYPVQDALLTQMLKKVYLQG